MALVDGLHDLMAEVRPLGEDVSVQLGTGQGFGANRTGAYQIPFHTIFRLKPRISPVGLAIRVIIILTL